MCVYWHVYVYVFVFVWYLYLCFLITGADFSLRDLGFGEAVPSHVAAYRTDLGLPHRDYSVSVGSDADTETDGIMSPEHAVRLWGRQNTKSGRSSCLSSRANSNLTLTDTEHENTENGKVFLFFFIFFKSSLDFVVLFLFRFTFVFDCFDVSPLFLTLYQVGVFWLLFFFSKPYAQLKLDEAFHTAGWLSHCAITLAGLHLYPRCCCLSAEMRVKVQAVSHIFVSYSPKAFQEATLVACRENTSPHERCL